MIIEGGGEGVMMRRVASIYERGRSSNLLKLKVTNNMKNKYKYKIRIIK